MIIDRNNKPSLDLQETRDGLLTKKMNASLHVGNGAFCADAQPLYVCVGPGDSRNENVGEPRPECLLAGLYD
jgi:hypothetical protein